MDIKILAKHINESEAFGIVVECGNGCVIADALFSVPGASKTIYESKQPYNKELQRKYYGDKWERSVSKDFIEKVLTTEWYNLPESGNFVLATSFQLSDVNQVQLAHGWIGVAFKDIKNKHFYHFSFPFNGKREDFLEEIKLIGIKILYSSVSDEKVFTSNFLDIEHDNTGQSLGSTLFTGLFGIDKEEENFITITPNGLIRFEDLVRGKEGIILQKGTYNPLHKGHIDIMNSAKEMYPKYVPAFLISINKYDKDSTMLTDLLNIIEKFQQLGQTVIICKKPLFKENINWIRKRWNLPIVFPVGIDTINRIAEAEMKEYVTYTENYFKKNKIKVHFSKIFDYFESVISYAYSDTTFLINHRLGYKEKSNSIYLKSICVHNKNYVDILGLSSTKIRNGEMKSNL